VQAKHPNKRVLHDAIGVEGNEAQATKFFFQNKKKTWRAT